MLSCSTRLKRWLRPVQCLLSILGFPIVIEKELEEERKKEKVERPKIEGEALEDLIKLVHGSYWPVWKIRDAFQKLHPKISARIVKKKVASLATKEKGPNDFRVLSPLMK